nr:XRE family transcriptional regulator [Xenorhabdus sp. PB30.3]
MLSSRVETAEILGIPSNALWRYECDETIPKGDVIMKIFSNSIYEKYALWFITGKAIPEYGQIEPVLLRNYLNKKIKEKNV